MCGLVGAAGFLSQDVIKAFHQLLVIDQLRGQHSTGVAHVSNWYKYEASVLKTTGTPDQLMELQSYEKLFKTTPKVLIGHNRYATVGKVTKANAHPFEFDNVVGAHNGSLRAYARLPGYGKFDVDSQVLYDAIDQWGLDTALSLIQGAYCLTYWNKADETMNFIRNTERPLYIAEVNKSSAILWASEEGMLDWILDRNAIIADEIYALAADVHVSVPLRGTITATHKMTHSAKTLKGGTALTNVVSNFSGQKTPEQKTEKKTEATATSSATPNVEKREEPDMEAARQKGALFCVDSEGVSAHGAPYFVCSGFDDHTYRLYRNQNNSDLSSLAVGSAFIADVNGLEYIGQKCVYRILASSVSLDEDKINGVLNLSTANAVADKGITADDDGVILSKEIAEEPIIDEMIDPQGRYMPKATWLKRYGNCAYCSSDIDPSESWQYIKDEIICGDCCLNPVIKDSLVG